MLSPECKDVPSAESKASVISGKKRKIQVQCCTKLNTDEEYIFQWNIQNFSLCDFKTPIISEPFSVKNGEHSWVMELSGVPTLEGDYDLSVTVTRQYKVTLRSVTIINVYNRHMKSVYTNSRNHMYQFSFPSVTFSSFMTKNHIMDSDNCILLNNALNISCTIIGTESSKIIENTSTLKIKRKKSKSNICEQLGNLLQNDLLCDVTLETPTGKIKAHKAVLAARSSVFLAMFANEMKEKTENNVVIKDIEYDVMKQMLEYMYTGKVGENASRNLMQAAEKYNLQELKLICEESLANNLSIDNAFETLVFANLCNAQELKLDTLNYMIENIVKLTELEAFNEFCTYYPNLMKELLLSCSNGQAVFQKPL